MPKATQHSKGTQAVCCLRSWLPSLTSKPDPTRPGDCRFRSCSLTPPPSCVPGACFPETCPGLRATGTGRGGTEDQARAGCSQRGPMGAGWADHSEAGATGRAPPLPVSSTNGPEQLCLRQGEAATLKNKNPKGGTSPVALEDCWPPPLHRAPWADSQGLGGTAGHSSAVTQGLPGCPAPVDGRQKPGEPASGASCFHTPVPGAGGAPTVLTQFLGEDLLEGHLTPVLQVLLHDAADAEREGRSDLGPL